MLLECKSMKLKRKTNVADNIWKVNNKTITN